MAQGFHVNVSVAVTGMEHARETVARMGAGMRNPWPVVEGLRDAIRQRVKMAFALGGYPDAWAPNARNTIAAKGHSKPLFRSRGSSGIQKATSVEAVVLGKEYDVELRTSWLGRLHQEGRGVPVGGASWIIVPVRARALRFVVAGSQVALQRARARSQAKRRAGGTARVPGRNRETVFAQRVVHPGYPARPFKPVIDDEFLQRFWRTPLHDYLFGGAR